MPESIELVLRVDRAGGVSARNVHASVVAVLDEEAVEHRAATKPFSVWPVLGDVDEPGLARFRINWLASGPAPAALTGIGRRWRLGGLRAVVVDVRVERYDFEVLRRAPSAQSVRVDFHSPTMFSRNGTAGLFPEAALVVGSVARRWQAFAEPDGRFDHAATACQAALQTTDYELSTVPALFDRVAEGNGWRDRNVTGFLGWADCRLPRTAGEDLRWALGVVAAYAPLCGIGHLTTHGFGAVSALAKG